MCISLLDMGHQIADGKANADALPERKESSKSMSGFLFCDADTCIYMDWSAVTCCGPSNELSQTMTRKPVYAQYTLLKLVFEIALAR